MKILIAGSTGYVGKRLAHSLLEAGHELVLCVRTKEQIYLTSPKVSYHFVDLVKDDNQPFPKDVDAAYFLVHNMKVKGNFEKEEDVAARNFVKLINNTHCKQIVYLSGLISSPKLSHHLRSRFHVEQILMTSKCSLTTLRAGIIIGSGSASFEIIRDLVEKLPVMIAPKWTKHRCQPISVLDVIFYLKSVLLDKRTFNRSFDIGGPQILTYQQMMLEFARIRKLKRAIITVPFFSARMSSYWLYFVTSTNYELAKALVDSLRCDAICLDFEIEALYPLKKITYEEAIRRAFTKIEQNEVVSSWKDALSSSSIPPEIFKAVEVPVYGCLSDQKIRVLKPDQVESCQKRFFGIGGEKGWYAMDVLWRLRGVIDKLVGGVGLRRGRANPDTIKTGESLDFWRVVLADPEGHRLILFAEMKIPGEAWLEFKIQEKEGKTLFIQTATFRPYGVWGRLYWYAMLPFHHFIFSGMANTIAYGK
jgi:uncharacterized protein YbjT (DUF2867 family)